MSYRGRPSKGCKRCVTKKVKCDQTHPACQRCLKAGSDCEYRDFFELVHRNQTHAAERMAKDKWRQRTSKAGDGAHSSSGSATHSSSDSSGERTSSPGTIMALTTPSPKSMSMLPSLDNLAYTRFVYDFAGSKVASPGTRDGAWEPLIRVYDKSPPRSILHHAISAVSMANFGSRFKSSDASNKAAVHYGKALCTFAVAVGGPKESLGTTEAMLGTFFLGLYEIITSPTFDGTWRMHTHGGLSILRDRWNDGTMKDGHKNRHLCAIYMLLLMNALAEGQAPPAFDPDWNLYDTDTPRGKLTELTHTAAVRRHELVKAVRCPTSSDPIDCEGRLGTDSALNAVLDIDAQLKEWYDQSVIGMHWIVGRPVAIHPELRATWARDLFSLPGAPKDMHVYNDVVNAITANNYRYARIGINLSVLRRAEQQLTKVDVDSKAWAYYETLVSTTATLMMELVHDICHSMPFLLQLDPHDVTKDPASPDEIFGFRGYLVFLPLIAATAAVSQDAVLKVDTDHTRVWVSCVMAFLRGSMGMAKAEAFQEVSFKRNPPQIPESFSTKFIKSEQPWE